MFVSVVSITKVMVTSKLCTVCMILIKSSVFTVLKSKVSHVLK